jgi:hypothetical protein
LASASRRKISVLGHSSKSEYSGPLRVLLARRLDTGGMGMDARGDEIVERACIHGRPLANGWCERCVRRDIFEGELKRAVEWITQHKWAAAESSLRLAWLQKTRLGEGRA